MYAIATSSAKTKQYARKCLHFPGVIFLSLCGDSRGRDEAKRNRGAAWHLCEESRIYWGSRLAEMCLNLLEIGQQVA